MSRLILPLVLLGAAAMSSGLSAEPVRPVADPTPAHQYPAVATPTFHSMSSNVPTEFAVQAVHNYGSCIAETTPQGARELLSMDYTTKDYSTKLHRLARGHADGRCMLSYSRLGTNPTLLAGAMAESLLKSDVHPANLAQRLAYNPGRQPIQSHGALEKVALCTVMANPPAVVRLLGTEPATPAEDAALQPISNDLAGCVEKDAKVALDKPAMRSLLALAAWRIANTPVTAEQ